MKEKIIFYATEQTPAEIKERGLILKRYYKVLLLCITFALISTEVHAKGISFFHFNESLCTCSATGGSSSFAYSEWFDQGLNTTSDIQFNTLTSSYNDNNYWLTDEFEFEFTATNGSYNILQYLDAGVYNDDSYFSQYSWYVTYYNENLEGINTHQSIINDNNDGIYLINEYADPDNFGNYNTSYIKLFQKDVIINTFNEIHTQLSGSGNAYVCVDESGKLYRSNESCIEG